MVHNQESDQDEISITNRYSLLAQAVSVLVQGSNRLQYYPDIASDTPWFHLSESQPDSSLR